MNTVTILKRARKLIEKPERWTKGEYARDRDGNGVPQFSKGAYAFCSSGALYTVCGEAGDVYEAWQTLLGVVGGDIVCDWNDKPRRTHAQVLRAFDKAIARAEKAGAK